MGLLVVSILQLYSIVPSYPKATHWLLVIGEKIKILHAATAAAATQLPQFAVPKAQQRGSGGSGQLFCNLHKTFRFPNRHPLPDQKSIKCTCRNAIIVSVEIWMGTRIRTLLQYLSSDRQSTEVNCTQLNLTYWSAIINAVMVILVIGGTHLLTYDNWN